MTKRDKGLVKILIVAFLICFISAMYCNYHNDPFDGGDYYYPDAIIDLKARASDREFRNSTVIPEEEKEEKPTEAIE